MTRELRRLSPEALAYLYAYEREGPAETIRAVMAVTGSTRGPWCELEALEALAAEIEAYQARPR